MNEEEYKIFNEEKFILGDKYQNDVDVFVDLHPDGAPDKVIAKCLGIDETEVEKILQSAILKIKSKFSV